MYRNTLLMLRMHNRDRQQSKDQGTHSLSLIAIYEQLLRNLLVLEV